MPSSTSSSECPGRALLCAAGLLLAAALLAGASRAPDPVLTESDRLMQQYEAFRIHVARDGHHDLLVLGNSAARQGVHVPRLLEQLAPELGRAPRGYNAGAGGTVSTMLPGIVDLFYGVDRPEWCVLVVAPRMVTAWTAVSEERGRGFEASPYGAALNDPLRWRGALRRFLLDHVRLFRLRYGLKQALLGDPPEPRQSGRYSDRLGYQQSQRPLREWHWQVLGERARDWSVDPERSAPLVEAVERLRGHGASVWLVEAPLHPRAAALFPEPERNLAQFRAILRDAAERGGARALLLPDAIDLGADAFADTTHLNERGARTYTRWIGEQIGADLAGAR